jgi:predicted small secreted protein
MTAGRGDCGATAMNGTNKQQVIPMKTLIALILLVAIGGLSGCNTIEGAGKDIQSGGDAVSDTARDVKDEM